MVESLKVMVEKLIKTVEYMQKNVENFLVKRIKNLLIYKTF